MNNGCVVPAVLGQSVVAMKILRCKVHGVELICPACVGSAGEPNSSKQKADPAQGERSARWLAAQQNNERE